MWDCWQTYYARFMTFPTVWCACFMAVAHSVPRQVRLGLFTYVFVVGILLPEALVPEGYTGGKGLPIWWYVLVGVFLAGGAVVVSLL